MFECCDLERIVEILDLSETSTTPGELYIADLPSTLAY